MTECERLRDIIRDFMEIAEHTTECAKWVGLGEDRWVCDHLRCTCGLDEICRRAKEAL